MRSGKTLGLVLAPFNLLAKKIEEHSVAETFMAPVISQENLRAAFKELDTENKPNENRAPKIIKSRTQDDLIKVAGRFGARRHAQYESRFPQPTKRTPFQS